MTRIAATNEAAATKIGAGFAAYETDELEFLRTLRASLDDDTNRSELVLALSGRAWIYPGGLDLAAELDAALGDKSILFASDVADEKTRWNPSRPNASQVVFRRGDRSASFLDAWIAATETENPGRLRTQNALWKIASAFRDDVEVLGDYWRFAARRGYLIRNFYLAPDADVERELDAVLGADATDSIESTAPSETPRPKPKGTDPDGIDLVERDDAPEESRRTPLVGAENESAPNGGGGDASNARIAGIDSSERESDVRSKNAGGTGAGTDSRMTEPIPTPKKRSQRKKKSAANAESDSEGAE